ncbi:MAG: hypothetical protein AAGE01_12155 [Pseudomonadota bacterium]
MRHLAALLLLAAAGAPGAFERGLYFDPARNGHGFALERVGDAWVLVFYSYDAAGVPEWYLSVAAESAGVIQGPLDRFRYDVAATPPQQLESRAGAFALAADPRCPGSLAFSWELAGEGTTWCVERLIDRTNRPQRDFGGVWFARDPADVGWGMTLDFAGESTAVAVVFYYDVDGSPRWALGTGEGGGGAYAVPLQDFRGYCRRCDAAPLGAADAGPVTFALAAERGPISGTIELAIEDSAANPWRRDAAIQALSDPERGLIALPATLSAAEPVAFLGATVIPMTDNDTLLADHTIVVRDGLIEDLGPRSAVAIPSDARLVDARDHFLTPGLSEMHLHITVGGPQAARDAGTLMIANGVTTAFNVGDAFSLDVPDLAREFADGATLGPTLYTANVAYGPNDNADAGRTVRNGREATAYAERLAAAGYDFLKVYWGIPVLAFRQYVADGDRLDMPVIGHLPLLQPMETSLAGGQVMAVHIQEPYVTLMNRREDPTLIRPAAELMLRYGTYLTPTLAVFESYTSILGGDTEAFNALINREGSRYQPLSIRNAWRSYFDRPFIQDVANGSLDGQFDFFMRMTGEFDAAGVPLLVGTDAPGFPGVMSGYGAIEELRLFVKAGIPPARAFAAATRNAGAFIDDTLAPDRAFGTIETGKVADLLLLEADPRLDIEHVTRRVGVMSRGRWFSADDLQAKLEALPLFRKDNSAGDWDPDRLPFCADHLHLH